MNFFKLFYTKTYLMLFFWLLISSFSSYGFASDLQGEEIEKCDFLLGTKKYNRKEGYRVRITQLEQEIKRLKEKCEELKKTLYVSKNETFMFQDSQLAHHLLDGLRGLEIGASAHNPFHLNTLNVDYSDSQDTSFKQAEIDNTGHSAKVDIIAPGDDLPFKDNVVDFVISSHVIEHFYDPIKTMKEWLRVVKKGGYVFVIAPHKERTFDKDRPRTTLAELIDRHEYPNPPVPDHHGHYSVWITEDFIELCHAMQWEIVAIQDVDDKVGNGFTVVIRK